MSVEILEVQLFDKEQKCYEIALSGGAIVLFSRPMDQGLRSGNHKGSVKYAG